MMRMYARISAAISPNVVNISGTLGKYDQLSPGRNASRYVSNL